MKTIIKCIAAVVTWLAWKQSADIGMCWVCWLILLSILLSFKPRNLGIVIVICGITCNAIVTLLNYGIMPVVNMASSIQPANPIWHAATQQDHLLILADHASLGYFSIGDLIVQAGLLVLVVNFIQRMRTNAVEV